MKTQMPLATHTLLEFEGCEAGLLNAPEQLKQVLLDAVRRAHGTIVAELFHTFSPHGVTGVVVIAESHVAIHTWPEHGYAAVDVFSCGSKLDHASLRASLQEALGAARVESRELARGLSSATPRDLQSLGRS
jgi:S-adenosylmethionine decarboxylase proenzyme